MVRLVWLVGLPYLVLVMSARGQGIDIWNNPRTEAEFLSLEVTNELSPQFFMANQIQADLAAIRSAHPDLANIRVRPDWLPGELLVGFTSTAYAQFKSGSFTGFNSLYATLGVPQVSTHDSGQWARLQFGQLYHGVRLAELFQGVNGVQYAEPNGIIGDGNDIVARANRTYTLSRGFGDCPSGCIDRESWDFTVTDGGVFPGLLGGPGPINSGDFNDDGVVDTADYVVWRNGMGTTFNASHYTTWRSTFGTTTGGGSGQVAGALPEPSCGILLLLSTICVAISGNRTARPTVGT